MPPRAPRVRLAKGIKIGSHPHTGHLTLPRMYRLGPESSL
jgi:hypothetical protein